MISRVKHIIDNKTIENLFHIGIVKFANMFSRYFLILYLIRVLGEHSYGVLTWIESFIQYFIVFINFGFDIFIVKKIIENRDNKKNINKIISTVLTLKLILFLVSFLFLSFFIFFFGIKEHIGLFFLMLFMGIGEVFFPLWYFQGIQNMKYLSLTSLISKSFLIVITLIFISSAEHLYRYILILVISNLILGSLGFFFLVKKAQYKFEIAKKIDLFQYFKEGLLFYLGKTSTLFMNFGTIFLIGKFFSKDLVTGFDLSSKVIFVFIFIYEVIQQAVFPSIVASQSIKKLMRLVIITFIFGCISYACVYIYSENFLSMLGGNEMIKYNNLLKELAILIPIIGITTVLGSCGLVAFGALSKFNYSFLISAALYIIAVCFLYMFNIFTFENLIIIRIGVDFVMAILILFFSVKINLFRLVDK